MNLSPHFTLEELTETEQGLRHGIANTPGEEQLRNLRDTAMKMEAVRTLLGLPIYVSSAFRSPALNVVVGGSKTSAHVEGWAIDFTCPGFGTPIEICRAIKTAGIAFDQLIFEGRWVHISFAPAMRGECWTAHFEAGKVRYTVGF